MAKLLAISLNPNISWIDAIKASPYVFSSNTSMTETFENTFAAMHGQEFKAKSFYTGRTAWYAILKALGIEQGDEVLVPAFTCVAVVNPIRWLGAKPIFVDITDDYVMDIEDAKRKISAKTKVLLIQHTFGHVVDISRYKEIVADREIKIIEDCAHALGSFYDDGTRVGTKSDAAFFSFGRDKCLSALAGGIALSKGEELMSNLEEFHSTLSTPNLVQRIQDLLYPFNISCMYALYRVSPNIAKGFHKIAVELNIIRKANSQREKQGLREDRIMKNITNMYAWLGMQQLKMLEVFTSRRKDYAKRAYELMKEIKHVTLPTYQGNRTWLRVPFLYKSAKQLRTGLASKHIVLGDWYDQVIGPNSVSLDAIDYTVGMCPNAERISEHVVNLPTNPRMNSGDIEHVIRNVIEYIQQHDI